MEFSTWSRFWHACFVYSRFSSLEKHRADWLMDERVEKMKMIAREAMVILLLVVSDRYTGWNVQETFGTEVMHFDQELRTLLTTGTGEMLQCDKRLKSLPRDL